MGDLDLLRWFLQTWKGRGRTLFSGVLEKCKEPVAWGEKCLPIPMVSILRMAEFRQSSWHTERTVANNAVSAFTTLCLCLFLSLSLSHFWIIRKFKTLYPPKYFRSHWLIYFKDTQVFFNFVRELNICHFFLVPKLQNPYWLFRNVAPWESWEQADLPVPCFPSIPGILSFPASLAVGRDHVTRLHQSGVYVILLAWGVRDTGSGMWTLVAMGVSCIQGSGCYSHPSVGSLPAHIVCGRWLWALSSPASLQPVSRPSLGAAPCLVPELFSPTASQRCPKCPDPRTTFRATWGHSQWM